MGGVDIPTDNQLLAARMPFITLAQQFSIKIKFKRHPLVIAAAVPSTVASAAVWTRRAGGNEIVALIVTVVTNSLCFLVTPLWVLLATGRSGATISRAT